MENIIVLQKKINVLNIQNEVLKNIVNFEKNSILAEKNILHCNLPYNNKIVLVGGPYKLGVPTEYHNYEEWVKNVIELDVPFAEYRKTSFFYNYPDLQDFIFKMFPSLRTKPLRMLLSKLHKGKSSPKHYDIGKMYKFHRFHLSIFGKYTYYVENEKIEVEEGTLFWFNNKKIHWAENSGSSERINLIFDVDPKDCLHLNLPFNNYCFINFEKNNSCNEFFDNESKQWLYLHKVLI